MTPSIPVPVSRAAWSIGPILALTLCLFAAPATAREKSPPARTPKVQIALLLDNSGSMGGLLNQARTQLWRVVNEFAEAKQRGRPVRVELALYEYGDGVKRLSHLTSQLDSVSEQLFGLGIRGGDEWAGAVIRAAVRELEWSGDPDDLKLIYIAGNEPFTQGPVRYQDAITEAKRKGIIVNVVHCGGDEPTWREGARFAGGSYLTIDHNARVAQVVAPQDRELAQLGARLNQTYVGYGARGAAGAQRQERMDRSAAAAAPAAAAERTVAKSGRSYENDDWDLVDATGSGAVKLEQLAPEQLPAQMKGMSAVQRKAHLEEKAKERATIQKRIAELAEQRRRHLAEEQKKAPASPSTLDTALGASLRDHAATVSISFE
jgi:hypothetical protein